jgi:hypothetical protein
MPAILNEDLSWEWIFGSLNDDQITEIAVSAFPSEQMDAYTIAKDFKESSVPNFPFMYEGIPDLEF